MCARTGRPPAFEKTVGELKPGEWYHDPNGETWLVTNLPRTADSTVVVNIGNRRGGSANTFGNALNNDELAGTVTPVYSDIRLGRDRDGRLYSSTFLNDWYYDANEAGEILDMPAK